MSDKKRPRVEAAGVSLTRPSQTIQAQTQNDAAIDAPAARLDGSDVGPKYRRVYAHLHQAISDGTYPAGTRLPSENLLVTQFACSRPTIGRALAQLESEGLVERRVGSGTFVLASPPRSGYIFGLLIPGLGTTEIFEPICRGISTARVGSQHDLLWGPTAASGVSEEVEAEQLCEYFIRRAVTGVFFAPMELTGGKDMVNQRITRALDQAGILIVLLDRDLCEYPQRSAYDLVGIDNRRAGNVITDHLLRSGSRRIIFFGRPNSAPTVNARALGYCEAIRSFSVTQVAGRPLPNWVEFGDPTNIETVRNLIERTQTDAIVCANDFTAAQLMTSLNALGVQVPRNIRVTGMDDVRYASLLQTPLTTIRQPCLELGAAALSAMLDRVIYPTMPARDLFVDFGLIIRSSSSAAVSESANT